MQKVGFDQRLNEQVPLDLEFTDEAGQPVKLGDYFGDKPVILVLAYYRCPMLCTLVLNGLAQGMMDVPFDVGKEFQVVTVSFDPRETPELAAAKKKTYIERYGRPGAAAGWHFLTGSAASIKKLTRAVGFRYAYDARLDQFAHASGIMVLTPAGKISRYFYDVKYSGRDLRLGLVEASENKIGSPVDQILLYCFHYDPTEGSHPVLERAEIIAQVQGIGRLHPGKDALVMACGHGSIRKAKRGRRVALGAIYARHQPRQSRGRANRAERCRTIAAHSHQVLGQAV